MKVAVLGAAGGIGQPLSMLISQNPLVDVLHLYDVAPVVKGVAVDLSHCNVDTRVVGFLGDMKDPEGSKSIVEKAVEACDVIVIPAGVPRKPGMTRDDLFAINAGIVRTLVESIAKASPTSIICIITNPVNATVAVAAQVLKKAGVFDPARLFGVSTLDLVRSSKFVAELKGLKPEDVNVPVIGGHSGVTILPLLSQVTPKVSFTDDEIAQLTHRIQNAGTEVVDAKAGGGSATLSMAFAGARFVRSVLEALTGKTGVVECAYVSSTATSSPIFAEPLELGKSGIQKFLGFGTLSPFEKTKLEQEVMPALATAISKGEEFCK